MEVKDLLEPWSLSGEIEAEPAEGGINNLTWFVRSAEGRFVLRLYQNTADAERVRFEHAVLTGLAAGDLPFAVPAPVPTREGESLAVGAGGRLAALFRWIPGRGAEPLNLAQARAAGEAQAHLHRAMARLGRISVGRQPGTYGDLDRVHPLTADPAEALRSIGEEPTRLEGLLRSIRPEAERLYRGLDRQIIHADYARANVFCEGDRVTGVIDFEFACEDLRATDYAVALYPFALAHVETGLHWELLEAYAGGYASVQPLRAEEVEAIPTLLKLVRLVGLLHWTGRMRQGLYGLPELRERAQRALAFADWVEANQAELVGRLRAAGR
ncbi:MAG: homoserine kinase [Bacillota bacterium]